MHLVFLYVDSFQIWEKQAFSFSTDYQITYDKAGDLSSLTGETLDQIVRERLDIRLRNSRDSLLEDTQSQIIQLIVGRNGAGKSTLMNILAGCPASGSNAVSRWFAVYISGPTDEHGCYHVILEGNDHNHRTENAYTAYESGGKLCNFQKIRENSFSEELSCNYLVYRQKHEANWYQDEVSPEKLQKIPRIVMHTDDLVQIFDYAWQAVHTSGTFASLKNMLYFPPVKAALRIELNSKEYIVHDVSGEKDNRTGFKNTLFRSLLQSWTDEKKHQELPIYVRRSYRRKAEALVNGVGISDTETVLNSFYKLCALEKDQDSVKYVSGFLDSDSLPDYCFPDERTLEISIADMNEEQKDRVCRFLEIMKSWEEARISIARMSNGEVQLLNLISSIYGGLKQVKSGKDCILLLDEPDYGFHPEWSRNLLYYLEQILRQPPFNVYKYQMLITTHSPILLSDVLPENIIIIKGTESMKGRGEEGNSDSILSEGGADAVNRDRIVERSNRYGFMSNINDLMKQPFFMESLYGENARRYANKLIQEIVDLQNLTDKMNSGNEKLSQESFPDRDKVLQQIKAAKSKADLIGESVIREQMKQRLDIIRRKLAPVHDEERIDLEIKTLQEKIDKLQSRKKGNRSDDKDTNKKKK